MLIRRPAEHSNRKSKIITSNIPIELLAPARDLVCGLAAINHGADAIYIGAPKFGARSAAGNELRDIEVLVSHAHKFRARVYVTLNTILYDHELEEAERLVHQLYNLGADALIIQDMGLLEMGLPPIPLFASTQTHNYDVERIKFLEQVGFQRIILARELSLKQLREVRTATSLELEFFVHGALCVSFSGQCYFSQAVTGRSANRGECAQMCRLPYTLTDNRGNILARDQHLLSLKDLNLSSYLGELLDAGVTSFKIEGRLKDEAYVRNITAFYRGALDAIIEGSPAGLRRASSGKTVFSFTPDPDKTFNRGYTDYFIRGRRGEMVSLQTPKSLGKFVGTVTKVENDSFLVDGTEKLANGDGVCFFDAHDELVGVNINTAEGNRVWPNRMEDLQSGTKLYRNHDHAFSRQLKGETAERRIGVSFLFDEWEEGFVLTATDEDGVTATVRIQQKKELAKKPDAARANVQIQIGKTGESIYAVKEIVDATKEAYFLPVSILNGLRRECLDTLTSDTLRRSKGDHQDLRKVTNVPYPSTSLDYRANVVNTKAEAFYWRHGVQQIERGFELQTEVSGKVLMTLRHCLKFEFGLCQGDKGGAEELFLSDGKRAYALEFDCDRCEMKILAP